MSTSTVELSDTVDTLGVAYHEVGHGLAGRLGGMTVRRLRLERKWWSGNISCGYTLLDPPAPDSPPALWRAYAVMLFTGQTAQLRYLDQAGACTPTVHSRIEKGAHGDFELWLDDRTRCPLTESQARRAAEQFCDTHWARMTRLAERLARTAELAGSAL